MRPSSRSTSLILGVIAKAQEKYAFPLYGYAYLSNHGSILLGIRSAAHLSRIMNFIHSNIAQYRSHPIVNPTALSDFGPPKFALK